MSDEIKDLIQKKLEIEASIAAHQARHKTAAIIHVRSIMDETGLTLEDLGATAKAARKAKIAKDKPKAAYTNESGQTWAGLGKRPNWLREKLAAGATLEQFRIAA